MCWGVEGGVGKCWGKCGEVYWGVGGGVGCEKVLGEVWKRVLKCG